MQKSNRGAIHRVSNYPNLFTTNVIARAKLFTCSNQRYAFLCAVETVMKDSLNFNCAINQICMVGHFNFLYNIQSAFNCFAKSKIKYFNAPKLENLKPMVQKI